MATEFLENVLAELDGEPTFEARPWYNQSGDCVVFHTSEEEGYADRIDGILTLYRSLDDDEVIGFQIKGINAIIDLCDADGMEVKAETEDGNVTEIEVSLLLVAAAFTETPGEADAKDQEKKHRRAKAYLRAGKMAGEEKVKVRRKAA